MNVLYGLYGIRGIILRIENIIFNLLFYRCLKNVVKIFGFPIIVMAKGSTIKIGKGVTLISATYFSEPGINHPVILRTLNNRAKISIGDNVGISGGSIIAADEVRIGNNVLIGANVIISDTDFHPINPRNRRYNRENIPIAPIVIEDNVFLGMNSMVLKGVTIGRNSVIGAGSIVTKSIPANSIAAGVPAKIIRYLEE